MLNTYLNEIFRKFATGDASERTYYPVLESFLSSFSASDEQFLIMVESRNSSLGIPDFRVDNERKLLLGYIEAKDLGRDLDNLTPSEDKQIEGYKKEYPKLIVTNFIEFRLYEEGIEVDRAKIAELVTFEIGSPVGINEGRLEGLLVRFFSTPIPKIYSARKLAELLAVKAHVLRNLVRDEIDLTDEQDTTTEKLLLAFRKTLRPDITEDDFADMYAQTVTYGLFSARLHAGENDFTRLTAYEYIPTTMKLLKQIFHLISGQEIPQHIKWQVDEIAEILANTDIDKIQEEFFTEGKGRDPIIHFYETFLAKYDPKEREKRGVYYTPEPVVSYISRSVHELLKEKFGKTDGFADPSVTILDPASGTLTFLANAIALAKDEYVSRHGDGGWRTLVKEHILKNFYAFELLMAPYTIGHLKISLLLRELGYVMENDDRFKLYLTNTLDFSEVESLPIFSFINEITEESRKAYEIKTQEKILVVMGNPPYSGQSENKGEWIMEQMKEYKQVNGEPLGERNPKWLNDDYVKFIRLAQWKVEQSKSGVIGFITNHAWIDNPTFRGMRASLLKTFDEIYILNLHGSVLKKETTPDGSIDENVFDIQTGTAIMLCVKTSKKKSNATVYYRDLWGGRDEKYVWLEKNDIKKTDWSIIVPVDPHYLFIPVGKNNKLYQSYPSVKDLFIDGNLGIQTHRDDFVIAFNEYELTRRIELFYNPSNSDEIVKSSLNLRETESFKIESKRKIPENFNINDKISLILNRPFDVRKIFFEKELIDRPRMDISSSILNKHNLVLLVPRQVGNKWHHSFVSETLAVDVAISSASREANYTFPLYLYNNDLFKGDEKSSNLNLAQIPEEQKMQTEEMIFSYIYAILYSKVYREKYQEFLKRDFPRIPFTKDQELFKSLAELGEQLVQLHLLKSNLLEETESKFNGEGDSKVTEVKYYPDVSNVNRIDENSGSDKRSVSDTGRVHINDYQWFSNVSLNVWDYQIGGYQVLQKWLKDRKGRALTLEDIKHYIKIITTIAETIRLQVDIDTLYPKVESSLE